MFLLWPPVISNILRARRVPPGAFPKTDKFVNFFMALHLRSPTQTTAYSTHNSVVLLKSDPINREWYIYIYTHTHDVFKFIYNGIVSRDIFSIFLSVA